MRTWALVVAVGAAALWPAPAAAQEPPRESPFPHARHARLFPVCTGCHEGVPVGDRAEFYPEPESCDGCHDGVTAPLVSWTPPERTPTNVRFQHDRHAVLLARGGDPVPACEQCHTPPGTPRMAVTDEIRLGACWSCHAHPAEEHHVDADCTSCHVPIAESGFGVERLAELPVPPDHESARFASAGHGRPAEEALARCATCHTRERCVTCHVDTASAPIRAMPSAPLGMELPAMAAHYNEPATHTQDRWLSLHGRGASRQACATCHTREDCTACHVSPAPEPVAQLPSRATVTASGVHLMRREPESHEAAFFFEAHGTVAAADGTSCATCHREHYCVECHDAPAGNSYHPADFVATHPAFAFGRSVECANCHDTQRFCRECHTESGLTGFRRRGPVFHDSQTLWLIRHGQSARQALESCASCHAQADCTRCHGTLGAFKVNPHARDFDARSAWNQNGRACLFCHLGNPLNGTDR